MSGWLSAETGANCTEPAGPELSPLEIIHRHEDGVITFHQKEDDRFENLFGIRAEHLPRMFPEVRRLLETNAFMSLNAFWHPEPNRHFLPAAQCRQSNRLRYLCACFADLDFYKLGLSYGQVIGTIIDQQDSGLVPPVSVVIRSGRGVWLVWLLQDSRNPKLAPRVWPEKQQQYQRIQRKIHESLAGLGADAQDALRITRVPGSIHSIARERVRYFVQADGAGNYYSYTLDELSAHFGVKTEDTLRRRVAKTSKRSMSRGHVGRRPLLSIGLRTSSACWNCAEAGSI